MFLGIVAEDIVTGQLDGQCHGSKNEFSRMCSLRNVICVKSEKKPRWLYASVCGLEGQHVGGSREANVSCRN